LLSNAQPITTGEHTLVLEMGLGGKWSYSIDGATPTAGQIAGGFDLTRSYNFTVRAQQKSSWLCIKHVQLRGGDMTLPDVDAGSDWVTWSGATGAVTLDDVVVVNNSIPTTALTYHWSSDLPGDPNIFDPNEFVESPTITITKPTGDPITVKCTLAVNNVGSERDDVTDTMTIDVYDDPCKAAIGNGDELNAGDIDADCDTDIHDFVAMAEEWLVYSELAGPVAKP
jgi:hypothetical protein